MCIFSPKNERDESQVRFAVGTERKYSDRLRGLASGPKGNALNGGLGSRCTPGVQR
jgi:hypothetical protein